VRRHPACGRRTVAARLRGLRVHAETGMPMHVADVRRHRGGHALDELDVPARTLTSPLDGVEIRPTHSAGGRAGCPCRSSR
jgi:hypothetical protein